MAKGPLQAANVINGTYRTAAFTKPAEVWVALFIGTTEVSGGGYTRIQQGPGDAFWTDPGTTGQSSNINVVEYPVPTATWGVLDNLATFTAENGGDQLYFGALLAPRTILATDGAPRFEPGALVVEET